MNMTVIELTAQIASSYLSNNQVPSQAIPEIIQSIYDRLTTVGAPVAAPVELVPAVPVRKSITPGYLICLEDGRKFKSLKRHLRTSFGMTPYEYRAKWGLPADYPMVAPDYSERRSQMAKDSGLGRKIEHRKAA